MGDVSYKLRPRCAMRRSAANADLQRSNTDLRRSSADLQRDVDKLRAQLTQMEVR